MTRPKKAIGWKGQDPRFGKLRMSSEEAQSIYSDLQDSGDPRLQRIADKFLPFLNGETDFIRITHEDYLTIKKEIVPWGTTYSSLSKDWYPADHPDQFDENGCLPSIAKFDMETGESELMDYIISKRPE